MSGLESITKIDVSEDNIPKIFENQRKNIQHDILFLKEDILKDFRLIETKLNSKYEKINSNVLTKIHKFEITLEAMNNKIIELSTLISTDNNIHQKIANLYEFKTNISDTLLTHNIAIKENEYKIKESINKYDKLIDESIVYPGVIGGSGRFKNFHDFIDYVLTSVNQFITFKEKNVIDYKGYKTKIEGLLKSIKMQFESIITTNNKYTNKKINELEKRIKEVINTQESKIFDARLENNKIEQSLLNKIEDINKKLKLIMNIKIELNEKYDEEIIKLKEYNKEISCKFENYEKEINSIKEQYNKLSELEEDIKNKLKDISNDIYEHGKDLKYKLKGRLSNVYEYGKESKFKLKDRVNNLNESTKNSKYKLKDPNRLSESAKDEKYLVKKEKLFEKKENSLMSNLIDNIKNQQFSNSSNYINNNININNNNNTNSSDINNNNIMKNGTIIKSIIKQYIDGEISLSEIDSSLKKQSNTFLKDNLIKNVMNNNYNHSLDNISRKKRMTFGPDKFSNLHILDRNLLNKFMDLNSEKSINNKSNNSISEEKDEDNDYKNTLKENNDSKDNIEDDKIQTLINVEISKNNKVEEKNDKLMQNKSEKKIEAKKFILNYKNKKNDNNDVKTNFININNKGNNNISQQNTNYNFIKNENEINNNKGKNRKISYRTISYRKIKSNNSRNMQNFGIKTNNTLYMMNSQNQIPISNKLCKIDNDDNFINYSNIRTKKTNKTNILFFDKIANRNNSANNINYYNDYNNYLNKRTIKSTKNRLNIIEVNFDEGKAQFKEDDELQTIMKKIKSNRINIISDRKNHSLEKKHPKSKIRVSDYDIGFENNSLNAISMKNSLFNYYFNNKMIKDELQKSNSFRYLNYIKGNKKIVNMRKMKLNTKDIIK